MMGFGFVVARFGLFLREIAASHGLAATQSHGLSLWVGTALVALGVLVSAAAAFHYVGTVRRLKSGAVWELGVSRLGMVTAGLLALIGAGMAAYLLFSGR
jgi:putative membrane protein